MTIRNKLVVLVALPLLAIVWMGWSEYRQSADTADEMGQIERLVGLSVHISALVHETQKERGMTAGYYGSEGAQFGAELKQQRALVDRKRAELEAYYDGMDTGAYDPELVSAFEAAAGRLGTLAETRRSASAMSIPAAQAIGYYTQTNAALLDTIGRIAGRSSDASLTLRITAYQSFLKSKERAGIERAVLSNTFARDGFGPGMYKTYNALVAEQSTYQGEFLLMSDATTREAYAKLQQSAEFARVQAYRDRADANAAEGGFGVDAQAWFDTISDKINALKGFEDGLSSSLVEAASSKGVQARRASWVYGGLALGLVVVVLVLSVLVLRSVLRPLRQITAQLRDIAEGEADLTREADASRRDELGELAGWFNTFVRRINDVIVDVARSTSEVASAATEIASSSEQMSASAGEQTGQITQVSAAIEEMSASVIEVARKAADAANSANESGRIAAEGGSVVTDTISGMKSINDAVSSSAESVQELGKRGEQIGEVITVINDIADQTNLLALNAAIEAARAGEHGRGFAVVADEVRKLADRTTKATQEIAGSIQAIQDETGIAVEKMNAGTGQVATGVEKAEQAGDALKQIVASAQDVSAMIQSIAAASEQQSAAGEEVSRSIQQINDLAGQNSAGVTQCAAAAAQLSQRAETLSRLVGQFKTRQSA